jgi:hypothetical protein
MQNGNRTPETTLLNVPGLHWRASLSQPRLRTHRCEQAGHAWREQAGHAWREQAGHAWREQAGHAWRETDA